MPNLLHNWRRLRHMLRPIILKKQFPHHLIRVKPIHIINQIAILIHFHLGKRVHTHLAAKLMIVLIAIHLINGYCKRIPRLQLINDIFQVLAIPAPGSEKLEHGDALVAGLGVNH